MNDRLKYRIYDTVEGEYIEVDAVRLTPNGVVVWTEKTEPELNPKRYIIEFCTGLKDRHGKLIYEGDIIVIPNEYPFYDCKNTDGEPVLNYIGIVKWIYSCWQYEYQCVNPKKSGISNGINNLLNEFGFDDDELSNFEVIGNVHTKPELLEKKDENN